MSLLEVVGISAIWLITTVLLSMGAAALTANSRAVRDAELGGLAIISYAIIGVWAVGVFSWLIWLVRTL